MTVEFYFENVYTDSEEMTREINIKIGMRKVKIWLWVYLALGMYTALFLLPDGNPWHWVTLLICVGYIGWILLQPIYYAKRYIKKSKAYYNGVIPQTVVRFGEEVVTVAHGDSVASVPYDKIDKAHFLKHSIMLRAGKMASVIISPSGFTKGTLREFQEFLGRKCPNLKLPEWQW